jgi:hypothetical protein
VLSLLVSIFKLGFAHLVSTTASTTINMYPDLYSIFVAKFAFPSKLKASDLRDHVYGLLALLDRRKRDQVIVRYDSPWTSERLYMHTTELVVRNKGPKVLQYGQEFRDRTPGTPAGCWIGPPIGLDFGRQRFLCRRQFEVRSNRYSSRYVNWPTPHTRLEG